MKEIRQAARFDKGADSEVERGPSLDVWDSYTSVCERVLQEAGPDRDFIHAWCFGLEVGPGAGARHAW